MNMHRKIEAAGRIYREKGVGGVLHRAILISANRFIDACAKLIRGLEVQRDCFADYFLHRHVVARNRRFENLHRGRRAFVIGNGPSLGKQDLSHLGGELTFAVNGFWRHPVFAKWKPTYYCMMDSFFLDENPETWGRMQEMAAAGSTIFMGTPSIAAVAAHEWGGRGFLPKEVYFVSRAGRLHDGGLAWPVLHRHVPGFWNVIQFALMAAIYEGCNPIYLLGCDHDFAQTQGRLGHFYADTAVVSRREPLSFVYEYTYYNWKAYEAILATCRAHGVSVLNATAGGMLDVFERVEYESLFSDPALGTSSATHQVQS